MSDLTPEKRAELKRDARVVIGNWPKGCMAAHRVASGVLEFLDVLDERDAEITHWKAHAEEAGAWFSRACKDFARVSARNVALTAEVEMWKRHSRGLSDDVQTLFEANADIRVERDATLAEVARLRQMTVQMGAQIKEADKGHITARAEVAALRERLRAVEVLADRWATTGPPPWKASEHLRAALGEDPQ